MRVIFFSQGWRKGGYLGREPQSLCGQQLPHPLQRWSPQCCPASRAASLGVGNEVMRQLRLPREREPWLFCRKQGSQITAQALQRHLPARGPKPLQRGKGLQVTWAQALPRVDPDLPPALVQVSAVGCLECEPPPPSPPSELPGLSETLCGAACFRGSSSWLHNRIFWGHLRAETNVRGPALETLGFGLGKGLSWGTKGTAAFWVSHLALILCHGYF